MFFSSGWLDSLIERLGLTQWVGPLRAFLRRARGDESLVGHAAVRSETPLSPPIEPTMPQKKQAKSKSPSRPQRAKAQKRTAKPAARKATTKRASAARKSGATRTATTEAVKQLVDALQNHPQQKNLVTAGQQKDQLLRSLIPLYLARALGVEVTSGTTSRFWSKLGVSYAAPNAAKALRIHTGYASDSKKGKTITAKGVRYVEDAIARG